MAIIVADVATIGGADDPGRVLFTLSLLTGVIMVAAGLLRLGTVLRFVSNAVLVGFINAVGVNIILGQLDNFTGYQASGANRVLRAVDTVTSVGQLDGRTVAVGVSTVALIVVLERTRLDPRQPATVTSAGTSHRTRA